MSQSDDFGSFMAGFILGGLVGAATALLLAPQSGEETRTIIRDKSIELRDKAQVTAEEARKSAEKAYEDARTRAEKAIDETRTRAEELAAVTRERATEMTEKGKIVLEEQVSKFEEVLSRKGPAANKGDEAPKAA